MNVKKSKKGSGKIAEKIAAMKKSVVEENSDVEPDHYSRMDDDQDEPGQSDSMDDVDSDEELQEAFAAGLLKPGLNTVGEVREREVVNDVEALEAKLEEFEQKKLPWIERLECVSKPIKVSEEESEEKMEQSEDELHNDFKREMIFYRQAQATVMDALPRLKSMNVRTQRPQDYFAQMLKSDEHMLKIREKLVSKQVTEERRQKVRRLRELKKFGKKVQVEVQQKRQQEKKDMMEQLKRFRKGQTDTIDFLDNDDNKQKGKKQYRPLLPQRSEKLRWKDSKFGYGGKKRGTKANDRASLNDVDREPVFKANKGKKGFGGKNKFAGNVKNKRPGKANRQKMKSRK